MSDEILLVGVMSEGLKRLQKIVQDCALSVNNTDSVPVAHHSCRTLMPKVVLIDQNLPDGGGRRLCRQLQAESESSQIRVVFYAEKPTTEEKISAFHAGAIDFISLDFSDTEIASRIDAQVKYADAIESICKKQKKNKPNSIDEITGLPLRANARAYCEELAKVDKLCCFVCVDVRRFKKINVAFNYSIGSSLLACIGDRLRIFADLNAIKFISRGYSADFLIIIEADHLDDDERICRLVFKLKEYLSYPIDASGLEFRIAMALGVSNIYPALEYKKLESEVNTVIARMHGKPNSEVQHYSDDYEKSMSELQTALPKKLRLKGNTLANQDIEPYLQPVVDLISGDTVCFEALARWIPDNGSVIMLPHEFIPLAEAMGTIEDIDMHMLSKIILAQNDWKKSFPGEPVPTVSINLSSSQYWNENILSRIEKIVRSGKVEPEWLKFEINEEWLIKDPERARKIALGLRKIGCSLCIDNFGMQDGSLNKLSELPFDTLKIDKDFIKSIVDNENAQKLLSMTIELGKSLGINIVAFGVESEKVLKILQRLGCSSVQGFYYGLPLPVEKAFSSERIRRS